MKLWNGRFTSTLDAGAARLNDSLPFDQRLAEVDVRGSLAWAHALQQVSVLTPQECEMITQGLVQILGEIEADDFDFLESDEDIHTAVERRLMELVGPAAGKLHTGRSRNDQVATDFRLWMMTEIDLLAELLVDLQASLVTRAGQDWNILLPGYTHFQQAQPLLLSHWWLSHFWALQRDRERLEDVLKRTRIMPLGSGALAGTSYAIDRFSLAKDLGFQGPCPNSLDGVSDRDFAVEFLFWAALLGVHLSRLAEALILYSTTEFGFVTLDDAFATGSSLMPQKKNPDPLELVRGKSGSLIGNLMGLLVTLKGLPSAYDKDLQEDKPAVFAACDQLELILPVMKGLITSLKVHPERTRNALDPSILATDLADYLVEQGIPFREAHTLIGKLVQQAEKLGIRLSDLPLEEWQAVHPAFKEDVFMVFDMERAISRRSSWGGTASEAVQDQLALAKKVIGGWVGY